MLKWTGERYIPTINPAVTGLEIHYEHLHRYAFASHFVRDNDVLDLGSGEGYGSYMLAQVARKVIGVDNDPDTIEYAKTKYQKENLEFLEGSICNVPLKGEKIFDVIVCFEALEHIEEQGILLSEIKRLLKDDGLAILSTPNKSQYTDESGNKNPFHKKELYLDEFKDLVHNYFPNFAFFGQKVTTGSYIWSLYSTETKTAIDFNIKKEKESFSFIERDDISKYFIAISANIDLSEITSIRSFCADSSDSILYQKNEQIQCIINEINVLQAINLKHQATEESLNNALQLKEFEINRVTHKPDSDSILYQKNEQIQCMINEINVLQAINLKHQATEESLNNALQLKEFEINRITNKPDIFPANNSITQRLFPNNTRRRFLYDIGLKGGNVLFSEGLSSFLVKTHQYISGRRGIGESRTNNFLKFCDLPKFVYFEGTTPDIICFPIIEWNFRYQRPQQLLSRLAKAGHRVFYLTVEIFQLDEEYEIREVQKNVFEIRLSIKDRFNIYTDSYTSEKILSLINSFNQLKGDFEIERAISFVEFPRWEPVVSLFHELYGYPIVYDCLDEYSDFSNIDKSVLNDELTLVRKSDLVITTSEYLFKKVKPYQQNVVLLPNAGDFDHFSNLPVNSLLNHLKKPIVGYYGAIAEWFDNELVEYIARERSDWNFVFIGNTSGSNIRELSKLSNVHFLGEKKYEDLPKYLYWFDVCLIPFKITELIRATHPVKFYEYLSAGKPTVSTKLPELIPYQHLCYLVESKDDAIHQITTALEENDEGLKDARIKFARENTWDNRVDVLLTHIHQINEIEGC